MRQALGKGVSHILSKESIWYRLYEEMGVLWCTEWGLWVLHDLLSITFFLYRVILAFLHIKEK